MAFAREDAGLDKDNSHHFIEVLAPKPTWITNSPSKANLVEAGELVSVHLYDLSDALANLNSVGIDLMGFGGALHVGVEVYGVEWSFGTGGVSCSAPKQNRHYNFRQTVGMGRTLLAKKEFEIVMMGMQKEWPGSEYELFSKNCGTFCNDLCIRIGVGGLPAWITRLAEAGGRSTTVRRIADMMARNGLIGEASPQSQSQHSRSQPDSSPRCTSVWSRSCSDVETPSQLDTVCSCDEEIWLPNLSEEEQLAGYEEELAGYVVSSPARTKAGSQSSAAYAREIPSPVRGSVSRGLPQRCKTFRDNAHTRPKANATLHALAFCDGVDKEKAFCMKRLALGSRPAYSSQGSIFAAAAGGGA